MANLPQPERPLLAQFILVAASLLCGTGVWLVVQLTETQEVELDIPVRPVNVPREVALTVNPAAVSVKFSFPATERNRMKSGNFYVELDFADVKERLGKDLKAAGDRTLSREMVKPKIQDVTPVELVTPQVQWEAVGLSARGVIEPTITGKPDTGYTVDVRKAQVEGPREIIVLLTPEKDKELKESGRETISIPLEPVDVTGRRGIIREQVPLKLPEGVSLSPGDDERDRVRTVVVEVAEETITRVLKDVPIRYQFIFSGEGLTATVDPPMVDVDVTGRLSAVNALSPDQINFGLFDVDEVPGAQRQVQVVTRITDADLRSQILSVETRPKAVTVTIKQDESKPGTTPGTDPDRPTPTAVATPVGHSVFAVKLEGATPEQRTAFSELVRGLPAPYTVVEEGGGNPDVIGLRVTTTEPISALLDRIIAGSSKLPFQLSYQQQTETALTLRVALPTPVATPATDFRGPLVVPTATP